MATLQAIRVVKEEEGMMESPRSPEARLGMKVEDLWDIQGAQLSPTEKLNACFEGIPVSAFPPSPSSQVVEIRSNASLKEAVEILARNKILSAPIVDVNASEDASWMERYTGIVEFAGIVVWILCQTEPPSPRKPRLGSAFTSAMGLRSFGPEPASPTPGTYFQSLISSKIYNNTTVQEISGSFRWGPFLALQKEDTFLTMLLLLSKYKMKSIPVIDSGRVDHIVTQSAVIHMLAECAGLHWFENWGTKKLSELGLPLMTPDQMVKVYEDEPVLQAFKVMRERGIGGVPVVNASGTKAVGNISLRDIQLLLMAPEIYHDFRSVTAKGFLKGSRDYMNKQEQQQQKDDSPMLGDMITCHRDVTMKDLIRKLDTEKIHRTYVVDNEGNLEGVITLRDIISKLVHEPRGYFGDFFDGVLPLPQNCRV